MKIKGKGLKYYFIAKRKKKQIIKNTKSTCTTSITCDLIDLIQSTSVFDTLHEHESQARKREILISNYPSLSISILFLSSIQIHSVF